MAQIECIATEDIARGTMVEVVFSELGPAVRGAASWQDVAGIARRDIPKGSRTRYDPTGETADFCVVAQATIGFFDGRQQVTGTINFKGKPSA